MRLSTLVFVGFYLQPDSSVWETFEQVTRVRRQVPNPPRAWDKASSTPWPITKKMILITEYKSSAFRFGLQNSQQFYFDATQDILRYPDLVALVDSVLVQYITNDKVRKFAEKHKSNSYIQKRCYRQVAALALVVIIEVCVHVPKTIWCVVRQPKVLTDKSNLIRSMDNVSLARKRIEMRKLLVYKMLSFLVTFSDKQRRL